MNKSLACPVCRNANYIAILTPFNKPKGSYWLKCTSCNFETNLGSSKQIKMVFEVYGIYVSCISYSACQDKEMDLEYIRERVLRAMQNILEEE